MTLSGGPAVKLTHMSPENPSSVRRFGVFEVDLRARELRKGGIRIRLQDQPFEILAAMLDRPGDIVTRDELRQRLWPDGTFVDFDHSLNAAIKRLRAALGDAAENPRFVETLHKRGYRFVAPVESSASGPAAAAGGPRLHQAAGVRMVVLPFANLSGDPSQEYFSDGLTEEMIAQIARLCPGRLGVIARTSSMLFKRSNKSASEIGRELGVDYLLEGSVRREGERVRITAQLIETCSELHLWAETYDRRLEESLLLQSEVAERIARSLTLELIPDQHVELGRPALRPSEAYQAYLKGRYHWNNKGDEGLATAIGFYLKALDLDPVFAAAHAALARARVSVAYYCHEPGRATLESARASALRAIDLDPGLPDAYVALAEVQKSLDWNRPLAEATYRRALALAPSCESAHRGLAVLLASGSRPVEAKAEVDRATDLDPLCLSVSQSAAWVRYAAGDFDEAIDRCRYTLDMDPAFTPSRRLLGAACLAVGKTSEALVQLETAAGPDFDHPISVSWLAHAKAVAGSLDQASRLMARLDALAKVSYVPPYHLALCQTGLGNPDAAFALLEQACRDRDPAVANNIAVEPRLEALRRDARFGSLLHNLGLAFPG